MGLNPQKGNMYPWVTDTWNVIKGQCKHNCKYCYMKRFKLNPVRFDNSELKTDLKENRTIFIGSSCDMWAEDIPDEWIHKILDHCRKHLKNRYLFQSKNPKRFAEIYKEIDFRWGDRVIIGTTLETNREYQLSDAPSQKDRYEAFRDLEAIHKMISIEPIVDFDLETFSTWIYDINPDFVSIGADSKGHNLPEPDKEKTIELINNLEKFTEVKIKDNLKRIIRY